MIIINPDIECTFTEEARKNSSNVGGTLKINPIKNKLKPKTI